ncbi:ORF40 [Haliotid herpesvirus 1]|nr:tc_p001c [Abalone herpesvirus Taiwan/2004]UCX57031.1 ORF40 [Haliotid herpesvirus 1]
MAKRQADTAFSAEISHEDIFKQLVAFHHYEMDIKSLDFKFGGTKKKPFCLIEFYSGKDLVDTLPKLESRVEVVAKVGERMLICKEPAEKMSNRDVVKLIRHSRFKMSYGKDKVDGLDWSRVDLSGLELMNGFETGVQEPPVKKAKGSLKENWKGFNTIKCDTVEDARKNLNFLLINHHIETAWMDEVTRDGTLHFLVKEKQIFKTKKFPAEAREVKKDGGEKSDESSEVTCAQSRGSDLTQHIIKKEPQNLIDENALMRLRNYINNLQVSVPKDETAPLFEFFLTACAKTASYGLDDCFISLHGQLFIDCLGVSLPHLSTYMKRIEDRVQDLIVTPIIQYSWKITFSRDENHQSHFSKTSREECFHGEEESTS